jgi:hypothetical protein
MLSIQTHRPSFPHQSDPALNASLNFALFQGTSGMKFPFQKFLKEIAQDLQKRQVKIEGIYFPSTQNKDEEFCCTVAAEMTNLTYPVSSQVKE